MNNIKMQVTNLSNNFKDTFFLHPEIEVITLLSRDMMSITGEEIIETYKKNKQGAFTLKNKHGVEYLFEEYRFVEQKRFENENDCVCSKKNSINIKY